MNWFRRNLHKLTATVGFLLALVMAVNGQTIALSPNGVDDTANIQSAYDRLSSSKGSRLSRIILNPGTYRVSSTISVRPGSRNIWLQGFSPVTTKIVDISPNGLNPMFELGFNIQSNSNYNVLPETGLIPYTLGYGAKAGTRVIRVRSHIQAFQPGEWVFLWDRHKYVVSGDFDDPNATSLMNHAEMAQVIGYTRGFIVLAQPVVRDYEESLVISRIHSLVNDKLLVSGVTLDGNFKPGAINLLRLGLNVNTTINDVQLINYQSGAVSVQDSLYTTISNAYTSPHGSGTGAGYGFVAARGSRFTVMSNIRGPDTHPDPWWGFSIIMAHGGGSDLHAYSIYSARGKLDTHGMDERNITFEDFAVADLHFGNHMHLGGGSSLRARNGVLSSWIWVQANTTSEIDGVNAAGVVINGATRPYGAPNSGYATASFTNCSFSADVTGGVVRGIDPYKVRMDAVSFTNCSFTNNALYGGITALRNVEGALLFRNSIFRTNTEPFFQVPLQLENQPGALPANIVVDNNLFINYAVVPQHREQYFIGMWTFNNGNVQVTNNIMRTNRPDAFIGYLPSWAIAYNNRVELP